MVCWLWLCRVSNLEFWIRPFYDVTLFHWLVQNWDCWFCTTKKMLNRHPFPRVGTRLVCPKINPHKLKRRPTLIKAQLILNLFCFQKLPSLHRQETILSYSIQHELQRSFRKIQRQAQEDKDIITWYTHLYSCWSIIIPFLGTPVKLKSHWLGNCVFQAPKPYLTVTRYLPWVQQQIFTPTRKDFMHCALEARDKRGWNSLHPFTKEGIPLPVPNYRISVGLKKLFRGSLPLVPPLPSEAREISSASLFSIFSAPFFLLRVRPRFRSVPSSSAVFTKV